MGSLEHACLWTVGGSQRTHTGTGNSHDNYFVRPQQQQLDKAGVTLMTFLADRQGSLLQLALSQCSGRYVVLFFLYYITTIFFLSPMPPLRQNNSSRQVQADCTCLSSVLNLDAITAWFTKGLYMQTFTSQALYVYLLKEGQAWYSSKMSLWFNEGSRWHTESFLRTYTGQLLYLLKSDTWN